MIDRDTLFSNTGHSGRGLRPASVDPLLTADRYILLK